MVTVLSRPLLPVSYLTPATHVVSIDHTSRPRPAHVDVSQLPGVACARDMDNATGSNASVALTIDTVPLVAISCMFCLVGVVGIVGNSLVIVVVLTDKKMRHSVTNLFIVNLAVSDLLIMVVGVPDIAQFMLNRGWLLGAVFCRLERYVLVFSLYASVLSLVAVCIER